MADHEIIHLNFEVSPMAIIPRGAAADNIPQEIIHHIQSLLNSRNAAKTTALSKSWRLAWTTRPVLDFHDLRHPRLQSFPAFAIETIQRYESHKLSIDSFALRMDAIDDHSLATWLILKAIKLGATDLTLRIRRSDKNSRPFALPDEVLDSQTLASLNLYDCKINLPKRDNLVVKWSNLKSIIFTTVATNGDLLLDFISKCKSLERVKLQNTRSHRYSGEERASYGIIQQHKLKSLELVGFDMRDNIYRHDLWPKFPCLKELVIHDVNSSYDWRGLRICSPSLEVISIHMYENRITNGRFDVPNIRKFEVVGLHLPELDEFRTSSGNREWESDIRVACGKLTQSWCSSLGKLLRQLSSSRISLSVHMDFHLPCYYSTYDGDGLRPVVEILKVCGDNPQLLPVFLKALLRRCRPKCITAFNKVYYQRHDATLNWYPAFEYYRRHEIDVEKRDAALLQAMDQ